jgi:hypothetical protein
MRPSFPVDLGSGNGESGTKPALLEAATFEDLPGKWQAAILQAEQNRPRD